MSENLVKFRELIVNNRIHEAKKLALESESPYEYLIASAGIGSFEIICSLLETRNLDKNYCDSNGMNMLHWASLFGNIDIVRYLVNDLDMDIDLKDNNYANSLQHAAFNGNLELVKFIVSKTDNINTKNTIGAICNAAYNHNLSLVKYFIEDEKIKVTMQDKEKIIKALSMRPNKEITDYIESVKTEEL